MFRRKIADPDLVHFSMIDEKPCFYIYLAFAHKTSEGREQFTEKELNLIARERFGIEIFEREQPNKKGMWQCIESDSGKSWELRFFPLEDALKTKGDFCFSLKFVLELLKR